MAGGWYRHAFSGVVLGALLVMALALLPATALGLTSLETLGKALYFDRALSDPDGQACSDCHLPSAGWADPDQGLPVSEGVIPGLFGGRNSPTAAYAAFSPVFQWDSMKGTYVGGQFWDGRAADLVAQAKGPFLNPVEMNNPDKATVVADVRDSSYAALFLKVFGRRSLNDVDGAYDKIAVAIAAFESSTEVNTFSSKFDAVMAGRASFTSQEQQGLMLFRGKGNCSTCHGCGMGGGGMGGGGMGGGMGGGGMGGGGMGGGGCGMGANSAFTDFSYDNLGVPQNAAFPLQAGAPADLGLGAVVNDPAQDGKFKVPTLRNVAATAPYTHNGYFTDLRELVSFYNSRDVGGWPLPEVSSNVSGELGDLGLTNAEIDAIVAFLRTLTDGYAK
jgi:cytochrome c peroxidase